MLLPAATISVNSITVILYLIYAFTLFEHVSATSVVKVRKFTRQTDFSQAECQAEDEVFTKTAERLNQCLIHCANEESCRTVLYDHPKCTGCTDTYMFIALPSFWGISFDVMHYQKTPECEAGWTLLNWSCYLSSNAGTFDDGKTWCGLQGGHVVSIETEEENEDIKENALLLDPAASEAFFIGFTDCETNSEWRDDTTGNLATFLDFKSPEPNDSEGECCVIMFQPWSYRWADYPCTGILRTLCEKPAN